MKRRSAIFTALAILSLLAQPALADDADTMLTIGSKAPVLDIEHWVQDNDGELKPVTQFKGGTVYVVEFWATWCGPCIASMPHLAETQQAYDYDTVRLISISDEPLETVTEFLEREFKEDKTFGDLTSVYSLTADPDRSNHAAYMEAAGQNGIPTSFIVGKDGIVEWIGHPMSMDEPLEQVVNGSWDREAFAEKMRAEQEAEMKMRKLQIAIRGSQEQQEEALTSINEMLADASQASMAGMQLGQMKIQLLASLKKTDELNAMIVEAIESAGDTVNEVMMATQAIAMLPPGTDPELIKPATSLAIERVNKLLASEELKGDDTMAGRVRMMLGRYYLAAGMKQKAAAQWQKAIELSDDERMAQFLESQIESLGLKDEKADQTQDDQ